MAQRAPADIIVAIIALAMYRFMLLFLTGDGFVSIDDYIVVVDEFTERSFVEVFLEGERSHVGEGKHGRCVILIVVDYSVAQKLIDAYWHTYSITIVKIAVDNRVFFVIPVIGVAAFALDVQEFSIDNSIPPVRIISIFNVEFGVIFELCGSIPYAISLDFRVLVVGECNRAIIVENVYLFGYNFAVGFIDIYLGVIIVSGDNRSRLFLPVKSRCPSPKYCKFWKGRLDAL